LANAQGFFSIARDFWQLHEIFGKCTSFFSNARGFFQMHGIFFNCTRFLAEIRGAEAKICDVETKYLARDGNMRCFVKCSRRGS